MHSSDAQASRVDVLTVTYGDSQRLVPLLQSLRSQTDYINKVYIWNNGPFPFDRDLPARFPGLSFHIHEDGNNLGYGTGINKSFACGTSDVAVVVNPDTALDSQCLKQLLTVASAASSPAIVGGLLLTETGLVNAVGLSLTIDGLGINLQRGKFLTTLDEAEEHRQQAQLCAPSGALFAVNRTAWEKMGGGPLFVDSLFLFLEDVALGLRVRRLGGAMSFCAQAKGVHRFSDTTGRRSALKLYYVERNRLWLQRALGGRALALATMPFTLLRFAAYAAQLARPTSRAKGQSGQGGSKELAGALLRAWSDGFFNALPCDLVPYLGPNLAGVSLKQYQGPLLAQLRDPTA
jgi:GT2 family glycosyltransferase